ncbi:MAG: hypothetical protein IKN11_04790 [Bacteroidales bacterium]|nr:hypothetical protein [Bacteroidales bacterium]
MKNIFKLFSVMLIAGAVLASCTEPVSNVTPKYKITVKANNDAYGTVSGSGTYDSNTTATLTATPNEGYKFVNWNDGNTNNPRIITVTAEATYTANFEEISGVNVTFGTASWAAQYVNGTYADNTVNVAAAQTSANAYPIINLFLTWGDNNPTTGTYTDHPSMEVSGQNVSIVFAQECAYLWYYENGSWDLQGQSGTRHTGDWWAKNLTVNVTGIDLTAMTFDAVVNAAMAHVTEFFDDQGELTTLDFNDLTSKDLTATYTKVGLTSSKGNHKAAMSATITMK